MSPELKNKIRNHWNKCFKKLEGFETQQIRQYFEPYEMAGLYAVASICYDEGNHKPMITDNAYNCLCQSLYKHFDECVECGASYLDRELLKYHSGYDMNMFVQPYHNIAEVLLGHPCRCYICMN